MLNGSTIRVVTSPEVLYRDYSYSEVISVINKGKMCFRYCWTERLAKLGYRISVAFLYKDVIFNFEAASYLSESDNNNVLYGRLNLQFQSQSSWNVSDYKHMKYWMKSNRNLIVQLRLKWILMLMCQAVRNDATTYRAIQKSENYVRVWFKFIDRHVSLFRSLSQSL